jgi:hypothetical protein
MPIGWLYNRGNMAAAGRQISEARSSRKMLDSLLPDRVLAISNRCHGDCSYAHKGLVTNWPHRNMFVSSIAPRNMLSSPLCTKQIAAKSS